MKMSFKEYLDEYRSRQFENTEDTGDNVSQEEKEESVTSTENTPDSE